MDKRDVAHILEEIGTLLELKGENPFKTRAYHNAARTILGMEGSLEKAVTSGDILKQKGIGKALAEKLSELVTTGKLDYYEELKKTVPEGLLEMLAIPGLGPRKAKAIHEELGISTVGELEYACLENRLVDLPGFGAKTQEKIIAGIEYIKKHRDRFLYSEAFVAGQSLLDSLLQHEHAVRGSLAGSLRRAMETVKDVDIVVSSDRPGSLMEFFVGHSDSDTVLAHGDTKSTIRLRSGINVDLRVVADEQFPFALHHFTGSKEHNTAMRARAKTMGLKMNEYGLFKGDRSLKAKDEAEIFASLGLSFIPPELREDKGEIQAAGEEKLPELVDLSDLKGILHVHTHWSDGSATLEEMARAAHERGYEYLGIAEHSKSAYYAGGLDETRVREQHEAINKLNKQLSGIRILKGIESDILPDGSLDYADEMLQSFDFVIASIHSGFNLSEENMTKRIIKAMSNKYVDMLGHPSGRLLLARDSYRVNMETVLGAAAEHGVCMELNANPHRLDLDWRWGALARSLGVKICVNPDAHHVDGLDDVQYGIGIARKGWFTRNDVLNCLDVAEFMNMMTERKK